jgi:hypothetical protein
MALAGASVCSGSLCSAGLYGAAGKKTGSARVRATVIPQVTCTSAIQREITTELETLRPSFGEAGILSNYSTILRQFGNFDI